MDSFLQNIFSKTIDSTSSFQAYNEAKLKAQTLNKFMMSPFMGMVQRDPQKIMLHAGPLTPFIMAQMELFDFQICYKEVNKQPQGPN